MSNVFKGDFDKVARVIDKGSEPPDDTSMEARIVKLESAVEYIQRDIAELKTDARAIRGDINSIRTTDFRLMFGAIIATTLGLAAIMAKGFGWL